MKRLLWTSAMALTAVACLTACDDSGSSSSNEIPTYKTEAALPDTCEMEVAKAGDTYFACFENKWVEVTDSATVEKIKEGLDEEDLKEELEDMMAKLSSSSKKPSSSSKKVESSDDEGNTEVESSSSEEECTGRRCKTGGSSSSKKSSGGSGNGGSGSEEPTSAESSSPSSAESSSPSSAETSSPSSASSSSLKRNANFSPIDDYVTWSDDGTKATLNNDIDLATLQGIFTTTNKYQNLDIADKSALTTATKALEKWGSPLKAELGDFLTSKRMSEELDSNFYILIVNGMEKGDVVYTDIAPTGLCGTSTYAKRVQFCDTRGTGTLYKYVTIGEQTWMAENLNYETASGSYCYDDDPDNCDIYGRLYTWVTAIDKTIDECGENKDCNLGSDDVQGVCPEGWHLPSKTEWEDLFTEVGGKTSAGNVLKSSGDNTYGFSALLGGNRQRTGGFELLGDYAQFWTATQAPNPVASYSISMFSSNDEAEVSTSWYKNRSLSVRCVKD